MVRVRGRCGFTISRRRRSSRARQLVDGHRLAGARNTQEQARFAQAVTSNATNATLRCSIERAATVSLPNISTPHVTTPSAHSLLYAQSAPKVARATYSVDTQSRRRNRLLVWTSSSETPKRLSSAWPTSRTGRSSCRPVRTSPFSAHQLLGRSSETLSSSRTKCATRHLVTAMVNSCLYSVRPKVRHSWPARNVLSRSRLKFSKLNNYTHDYTITYTLLTNNSFHYK